MTSPQPNRRRASIPAIRVLPETRLAMKEIVSESGQYASRWQLEAYQLMAGDQMTSSGPFSEVIRKELER